MRSPRSFVLRAPGALRAAADGNAIVELAVLLPLLMLVLLGGIDFGRIFYTALSVTHAVRAGVQYGAQGVGKASDYTGMRNAAVAAATDISSFTAPIAGRVCRCSTDTATMTCPSNAPSGNCLAVCTVQVYVCTQGQRTFQTIAPWPGIPSTVTVTRTAWMRVQ